MSHRRGRSNDFFRICTEKSVVKQQATPDSIITRLAHNTTQPGALRMKFASLNKGPDGQVLLVSKDLQWAITIPGVAPNLREILDIWGRVSPSIDEGYRHLNAGEWKDAIHFDPASCTAPLPRASQLLRDFRSIQFLESGRTIVAENRSLALSNQPVMYLGGSDSLIGPQEDITGRDSWGVDFQAALAVITDRVPMGCPVEEAHQYIRLLVLCNDIAMRNLIPEELYLGTGPLHSIPCSSFSPVAVTPDELGEHWQNGKLHLDIRISINDTPFSRSNCATNTQSSFHELIAQAARFRQLGCGTVISSGPLSRLREGLPDFSSLAEKRLLEKRLHGAAQTEFMNKGDRVRMEILTPDGLSLFGAIEQTYIGTQ